MQDKAFTHRLPATPWGFLPPRMRVLYITTPRRTGAWLAEAFAADSASQVVLEEAHGAAAGLAKLREQAFDAILVSHEGQDLDALEFLDGLRGSGAEEPVVILGQASEQELAVLCYEVGADAYVCVNTTTTRTLLWIVARAIQRHDLVREHRRLSQAERHRLRHDNREAEQLISQQRSLTRDGAGPGCEDEVEIAGHALAAIGARAPGATESAALGDSLTNHYRELLRAHAMMDSGNLSGEMGALVEQLADSGASAPQIMQVHVQVLEELVRGLGSRSARHVMTRANLLILELLVHLAERYRVRCESLSDGESQSIGV